MACLLWMLLVLQLVLPAVTELPQPVDVAMVTTGLSHLVQWNPGAGTPVQASYCVSIQTERGVSEHVVSGCERVQQLLLCNLTKAFSDPTETYITVVRAVLDEQVSRPASTSRYKPIDHMAPPLMTVTLCGGHLCVDLQPPHEDYRNTYNVLSYQLHVEGNNKEDFFMTTQSLGSKTLKDLTPGGRYCISVSFWVILEETKSNFSKPVCSSIPAVHSGDSRVVAVLVPLVLLVLLGAGGSVLLLILMGLVFLRSPLPSVLTSIRHMEGDMAAPCSASLTSLWIVKSTEGAGTEESPAPSTPSTPSTPARPRIAAMPTSPGLLVVQCSTETSPGSAYNHTTGRSSLLSSSSSTDSVLCFQQAAARGQEFVDDEDGDGQDVNLSSLRLGTFQDIGDQDKFFSTGDHCPSSLRCPSSLHCLSSSSPCPSSPYCPSSSSRLQLLDEEAASAAASSWTDEEEPDGGAGYLRRSP